MPELTDLYSYMRQFAADLGERILDRYPALHQFSDPVSPCVAMLLRRPFPAQSVAIMGIVKRRQIAPTALVAAECGAGKTLISLGGDARVKQRPAIHGHRHGAAASGTKMGPRGVSHYSRDSRVPD